MKFTISAKAKKHIEENQIRDISIDLHRIFRGSCCGLPNVDFIIDTNNKDNYINFKSQVLGDLEIYYNPLVEPYFKDYDLIKISVLGLGRFKRLYITNEINVMSL